MLRLFWLPLVLHWVIHLEILGPPLCRYLFDDLNENQGWLQYSTVSPLCSTKFTWMKDIMQLLPIWCVILSILKSQIDFCSSTMGKWFWDLKIDKITYQMVGNNCTMCFIQVNFVDQKREMVLYCSQPWRRSKFLVWIIFCDLCDSAFKKVKEGPILPPFSWRSSLDSFLLFLFWFFFFFDLFFLFFLFQGRSV